MTNLFDKLNVLIQSRVPRLGGTSRRRTPPARGRKADRELAHLRGRIEEALADDDRAQAEVNALEQQVADWDAQADAALAAGQDAVARHAIRQMKLAEQRLTMAKADLEAHRRATAELISQVNAFETAIQEARREIAGAEDRETSLLEQLPDLRAPFRRTTAKPPAAEPVDERAVEDDLARRRARLSE